MLPCRRKQAGSIRNRQQQSAGSAAQLGSLTASRNRGPAFRCAPCGLRPPCGLRATAHAATAHAADDLCLHSIARRRGTGGALLLLFDFFEGQREVPNASVLGTIL